MTDAALGDIDGGASIEFPADAAYVATARIFASAVARHYGTDEDAVHDIKLALSEACGALIRAAGDGPVRVAAAPRSGALVFEVAGPATPERLVADDDTTPARFAAEMGTELIRALFEDSTMVTEGERSVVRFSVALESPEG